eukprot:UN01623
MTFAGVKSLWDLGKFTNYQYVQRGFISGHYNRVTSQIRAAQSDRTLISASAWGTTTFSEPYANQQYSIPIAVLSQPGVEDNLLEVRKGACAARLEKDLKTFDTTLAPQIFDKYQNLLETVSLNVCGISLKDVPTITNGEFATMQMVKDLSDALVGDTFENFPKILQNETLQLEFLQFAEDIFKMRHFGDVQMNSYLTGNFPSRLIKLFDRRISYITNTTVLDNQELLYREQQNNNNNNNNNDLLTYVDIILSEMKQRSITQPPRPPRIFYAYHAHREVIYALAHHMKLNLNIQHPKLPNHLLHPGSGIFFELHYNETKLIGIITTKY